MGDVISLQPPAVMLFRERL